MTATSHFAPSASGDAARPLVLTMGEPAGIGPELTVDCWRRRAELDLPAFYVLGSSMLFKQRAAMLGTSVPIAKIAAPEEAGERFQTALPVLEFPGAEITADARPGVLDPRFGQAVTRAIETGVFQVLSGQAAGLVTNPINKHVLHESGFAFPGHTEYLAALAEQKTGKSGLPVMMLWSKALCVVPLTIHIPLAQVRRQITPDLIEETITIIDAGMRDRFGLSRPRIAVAGLNPHAGEQGDMGRFELDVLAPLLARLRKTGLDLLGPLPADTMFHKQARQNYDVALCMYHDQALIPIKTLAFDNGVNVTLGLPFVRTSPDHGTACDIAGKGVASPRSLATALRLAHRMSAQPQAGAGETEAGGAS